MIDLDTLGWDDEREEQFAPHRGGGLVPGRVAVQHRGAYDVLEPHGERRCEVLPRLVKEASSRADLPVVGDWVALDPDTRLIHAMLPRRSRVSRRRAGESDMEQVLVANVDIVFIVSSLNEELNLRRIERYLTLALESGARPVVVLTKADLHPAPERPRREVEALAGGVTVHVISAKTGAGLVELGRELGPGVTGVLLGSSGVGKSTLVNTLTGDETLATGEIRQDGRGRHTTTRRSLILLPGGGILIDTPGLRELQLWESGEGLEEAFADVTSLFEHCRFSDCTHESEPGCAVRAALAGGVLASERWESYRKLEQELDELGRRLERRAGAGLRARGRSAGL
jgi:ribosome biogenesis GTPase